MDFQGRKEKGELNLRELDKKRFLVFFDEFKDGTWFNISITRAHQPKTGEGNLNIHDPENHPDRKILDKRNMSKLQISQLIDNSINWLESVLGCQIPKEGT